MPRKSSLKERRNIWRNIFIGFGAVVFVGIFVLLWFGLRRPEVTIASVDVSGTKYINESSVKEMVQESLKGSYFWFIPKKNALFYPKENIQTKLIETFLPINIISIDRDRFTGLLISIEERQPIGVWCDASATATPCFLLDRTGLLFEEVDDIPSGVVEYQSSDLTSGSLFLDGDFFGLHEFITTLQTTVKHSVHYVFIDENDDVFVYFRDGGELRFVRTDDKVVLLDNISSTFSSRRFEEGQNFEYVDFRFGNKVYVKFINE